MSNARYDYGQQIEHAKQMAREHNKPVKVFTVYMPSVYSVPRSPLAVEPMPHWWDGNQERWIATMLHQGATIVMPDGSILTSNEQPK